MSTKRFCDACDTELKGPRIDHLYTHRAANGGQIRVKVTAEFKMPGQPANGDLCKTCVVGTVQGLEDSYNPGVPTFVPEGVEDSHGPAAPTKLWSVPPAPTFVPEGVKLSRHLDPTIVIGDWDE